MNSFPRENKNILMKIFKSPFLWLVLIIGLFLGGFLVPLLKKPGRKWIDQNGLKFVVITENTADKTGTVYLYGYSNEESIGNVLNIPSIINTDEVTYSVIRIGSWAFRHCTNLTSVSIPKSVTRISEDTFSFCEKLKSFEVDKKNQSYTSVDGVLFNKDMTLLVKYPGGKTGEEYIIPNSVAHIGAGAFEGCSLAGIIIPDSVTRIGYSAFSDCNNLRNMILGKSVTYIDSSAFSSCTSLASVTIPDGVASIGGNAFYGCTNLATITIPDSVDSIDAWTFAYCTSLTHLFVGKSVACIGWYAFTDCPKLTSIYFKGSSPEVGDGSFDERFKPVLYFIEGTPGWTTPTWQGYTTRTWTPEL